MEKPSGKVFTKVVLKKNLPENTYLIMPNGLSRKLSIKEWCFWTVVLKKTLESPMDCKESKPVSPKRNQSWIFTGRTDDEAEAQILWSSYAKSWLIRKDPDAGQVWRQEEKGATEDEMAGCHPWLNGHGFVQAWETVKDREAWRAAAPGVTKTRTWLRGWTTTKSHCKEMETSTQKKQQRQRQQSSNITLLAYGAIHKVQHG